MAPVSPLNDIKQVRTGQSTRLSQLSVPQKVVYIPFSPPGSLLHHHDDLRNLNATYDR
jgi:hypothetical protein